MAFGYCVNCKHWKETKGGSGICKIIEVRYGAIKMVPDTSGDLATWDGFGCPWSEAKPKGPFTLVYNSYGYFVRYKPTTLDLGYWTTAEDAERTYKEMNAEWATAMGERRE